MKDNFSKARRRVLKSSLVAVAGAAGLGPAVFSPSRLRADELPQVSEDDPTAKALEYVHDASTSETRTDSDAFCNNCLYYKGSQADAWARCDLLPGKLVNGNGWCNVWTKKG